MREKYKGFELKETVSLTETVFTWDLRELLGKLVQCRVPIKKGTKFTIIAFPPFVCAENGKGDYFIFGKTKEGLEIRANYYQVKAIRKTTNN